MIRHLAIAALRNMAASKLQTTIAVVGLSIGITAALLMALVIRNQLTFDHFIPGYERTYLGVSIISGPNPDRYKTTSYSRVAEQLKLNIPEIENAARLADDDVHLKHGQVAAKEAIYWGDPNIFDVLPLSVVRGDLHTALRRPDGIVMTESAARKYFGTDDALGQTVEVEGHPMALTAVLADLPANATELQSGIVASARSPYSLLAKLAESSPRAIDLSAYTYVRLRPGASLAEVRRSAAQLFARLLPKNLFPLTMPLVALDQLPLLEGLNPGIHARLAVMGLIGFLVLFIAAVNFVNLSVARATRREKEVGVRKAVGADRGQLILQFLGEAMIAVLLAGCVATVAVEWLLPGINALLLSGASFNYWNDPLLWLCLLAGVGALGLAAGAYPAFVLSAFRPATALKGWASGSPGIVRNGLVVVQFAILISLIIAAAVVFQQRNYAMNEILRVKTDQILLVKAGCPVPASPSTRITESPCWAHTCSRPAFRAELIKLPGVRDVVCTDESINTMEEDENAGGITAHGHFVQANFVSVEFGLFGLYGLRPVAGTLPPDVEGAVYADAPVVINVTAARSMGFATPAAALGHTFLLNAFERGAKEVPVQIAAVVPDFWLHSISDPVRPTIYRHGPAFMDQFHIRLAGGSIPETLAAIDRAWTDTGGAYPTPRSFVSDEIQKFYGAMLREGQLFSLFAGVAVFLACLGLFGLAVATAERRTKEIGIRKATGATNWNILGLMLWQFTMPVLWANLIAWPLAWWAMQSWLSGFSYRVTLHWWLFPAASVLALLIALLSVACQALMVARQKPVLALRYE